MTWLWLLLALLGGPGPEPSPRPAQARSAGSPSGSDLARLSAELGRLRGHHVVMTATGYVIEDIAGEGAPVVGVVERRGRELWLVTAIGAEYRLAGILARPRLAGPGYKIWALGPVTGRAGERVLTPRRLGVLGR